MPKIVKFFEEIRKTNRWWLAFVYLFHNLSAPKIYSCLRPWHTYTVRLDQCNSFFSRFYFKSFFWGSNKSSKLFLFISYLTKMMSLWRVNRISSSQRLANTTTQTKAVLLGTSVCTCISVDTTSLVIVSSEICASTIMTSSKHSLKQYLSDGV